MRKTGGMSGDTARKVVVDKSDRFGGDGGRMSVLWRGVVDRSDISDKRFWQFSFWRKNRKIENK